MKPLVFVNFKTYAEGTGKKGVELARFLNQLHSSYQIIVCPQYANILEIQKKTKLPVFAQHCDAISAGAHTGSILPQDLKLAGATGTFLNHSEKPLSLSTIKKTITLCKKNKLQTLVFAKDVQTIKRIVPFHPDYVAYEPSELVGGNVSVTTANPKIIGQAVNVVKRMNPKIIFLVGAGIQSKNDIQTALWLGAQGVVVAHAIVKASPKKIKQILL